MADEYEFTRSAEEINDLLDKIEADYSKSEIDSALASKVSAVEGKGLSSNDYTDAEKESLYELTHALGGLSLVKCTQSEYDAMETHDADTVYIIAG